MTCESCGEIMGVPLYASYAAFKRVKGGYKMPARECYVTYVIGVYMAEVGVFRNRSLLGPSAEG